MVATCASLKGCLLSPQPPCSPARLCTPQRYLHTYQNKGILRFIEITHTIVQNAALCLDQNLHHILSLLAQALDHSPFCRCIPNHTCYAFHPKVPGLNSRLRHWFSRVTWEWGRTIGAHVQDQHFGLVCLVCGQFPMLQPPSQLLHSIT